MKIFALLLFNILLFHTVKAQYNGTYTIGGSNPNFTTINEAIDSLHQYGLAGPVVLDIRNGIYSERLEIDSLPGSSALNTLTIESEQHDSNSVTIDTISWNGVYHTVKISAQNVILKWLTLTNSGNSHAEILRIESSGNILVQNCVFNAPNCTTNGPTQNSAINVSSNCVIKNNRIIGQGCGINVNYSPDSIFIDNNVILCTNYGPIVEGIGYIIFSNNIVSGRTNFPLNSGGSILRASNNVFNGNLSAGFLPNGIFENNVVNAGNLLTLDAKFIRGNHLTTSYWVVFDGPHIHEIKNNVVNGRAQLLHKDNCVISNNTFQEFYVNFSSHDTVVFNKIGRMGFSFSPHFYFANNFVSKGMNAGFSDSSKVYNNNIGSDSLCNCYSFYFPSYYSEIKNNNFTDEFYGYTYTNVISGNNYYTSGFHYFNTLGIYDLQPSFMDPQYVNFQGDLHAQNPQLNGKGLILPGIVYDIDSVVRMQPPSIGANEVCLDNLSSILINCGDSIILQLCNLTDSVNLVWTPSVGLNNVHSLHPVAGPIISTNYIVTDTISGFTDSVFVNVTNFQVDAGPDQTIYDCGDSISLFATYNAGTSYQWSPTYGLNSPNNYFSKASPEQTTLYIITGTNVCGTSVDSILVTVNPLPIAYAYLDSVNCNYFSFLNASTCADNYFWDFGDSAISTIENPFHIYADTGIFLVTLIVCNSFGCDTFPGYIHVSCISIISLVFPESDLISKIKIFPNPTSGKFTIQSPTEKISQITVTNLSGQTIFKKDFQNNFNSPIEIDLTSQSKGIYLIQVITGKKVYNQKIIVE